MRRRVFAASIAFALSAALAGMAIAASASAASAAGAASTADAPHDEHDHDAARITDARAHDPAVQDRRRATLAQAEAALARGDTGGDGFAVLLGGTNLQGGAQDIDALTAYLNAGYLAPKAPYDPTLPALKIPRISVLP